MKIKGIISEDFVNYKKPSMTIMFPTCNFKCGSDYCQNTSLAKEPDIELSTENIVSRYIGNPITEAIVMQGLEPFDSYYELVELIEAIRRKCDDDIVIYTGYNKNELSEKIEHLSTYQNIIIKFGRYIPNDKKHFDDVLGVYLASDNQYAEEIS
jgi:pyruvate-formate lyase-activating enzyme